MTDTAELITRLREATGADALADVAVERQRQIEQEGWSAEHDDEHGNDELACAAACYAIASKFPGYAEKMWPWDEEWWKPTDDRRNLVKAAALLIAEIERLDRIDATEVRISNEKNAPFEGGTEKFDQQIQPIVSIAISLKRVADALEARAILAEGDKP